MHRRRTTTLLPAAVLAWALTGCGASGAPDGADPVDAPAVDDVELVAPAPTAGRCAVPTAEVLAAQEVAFEGTVTSLEAGRATLQVDRWFTDDLGESVTVAAPSQSLQDLLVAVEFETGKTYLVSAEDGQVSLCGFSAESTPELTSIYEQAFEAE